MKPAFTLLTLLLVFLSASCKKEEVDALPKATQEGKNTMGCLVNGKAWKPYEAPKLGAGDPFNVYWRVGNGRIRLTMFFDRQTDGDASAIYIYVPDISSPGLIELNQPANPMLTSANPSYGSYIDTQSAPDITYLTGPTAIGQLNITRFDTTARIVSGTFNFTGRAANGSAVQVTEGRFDMRLERR
ncbi:DUF6252 family protein [Hymenobacter sp. APR13]|uniref:DUF6252 family protein n=1 Tax=Hymenobacter sp. APR13 TaxID=1356852 RepID=UPI0004E05A64|nr:DUF6252 family protein [Hymenobacter sp. APR13]AII51801.1 hypothetical protein N008_07365 [Hymenobacter sp. APR13]